MQPWLYWICGEFGSWKTLLSAYKINQIYEESKKNPQKKYLILSNIKMLTLQNTDNFEYIHFYDNDFKNALVTAWITNINDRINNVDRDKRTQNYIFMDEVGILMNASTYRDFDWSRLDFLLQCRKLNLCVVFWYQNYTDFLAKLRKNITINIYFKPFLNLKFLTPYIWSYRITKFDFETWKIENEKYIAKDEKGDRITKEKPKDYHYMWMFWKPKYYWLYDDLYINSKLDFKDIPTLWEKYQLESVNKYKFNYSEQEIQTVKNLVKNLD